MEIRELQKSDAGLEERFDRLVSSCFGLKSPASYLDDFPVWRGDSGADHLRLGVFTGSTLEASAAIRFARVRVDRAEHSIGIIGAVATAVEARGRGHASKLLASLVDRARERGCEAVALFGSELDFYAKLGFLPTGKQFRAPLSDLLESPAQMRASAFGVRAGWTEEILPLMRARALGLVVEPQAAHWLPLHRHTDWRVAYGADGKACAFAATGRGIDLGGFVHDWGGSAEGMRAILAVLDREQPGALQLLGPMSEFRRLGFPIGKALYDPLCLAQPLKPGLSLLESEQFWLWGLDGA